MSLQSHLLIDVIERSPENSRWMFSEGPTSLPPALLQLTERKHDNYYSLRLASVDRNAIKDLIVAHGLADKIVHQFIEDSHNGVVFEGYDHLTGCFLHKDFPDSDYLLETYQEILEEMV